MICHFFSIFRGLDLTQWFREDNNARHCKTDNKRRKAKTKMGERHYRYRVYGGNSKQTVVMQEAQLALRRIIRPLFWIVVDSCQCKFVAIITSVVPIIGSTW